MNTPQSVIIGTHAWIDPQVAGFNTTKHWKQIAGTTTLVSDNWSMPQNADMITYFNLGQGFDVEWLITVPTTPTAGHSRKWDLENICTGNRGRIGYTIADANLVLVAYSEDGTDISNKITPTKTIPWISDWGTTGNNVETSFRLKQSGGRTAFIIAGKEIASLPYEGTFPVSVRITNGVNDNMLVGGLGLMNVLNFS